jgi:23S rRNA (guanine745-N1)-methyltransferase
MPDAQQNLCCRAGHSFDRAKEGYWHLLPVQEMRSKVPGDSKEMVAARRAFLTAGYYRAFGEALGALVCEAGRPAAPGRPLHVLDAGCGEGWYDRAVDDACEKQAILLHLAGFDIAKPAVRLAAKALPTARYAVASSFRQPVESGWADVLLNIFSPFAREEFLRVLRPGGLLVYAVPGPQHLFGMKQALYEHPYENPVREIAYEGFRAVGERDAEDTITVPQKMLEALFSMTPYYWKTPADGAARLRERESLTTPIQFRFLLLEKT